jgi:hypothetical protein
VTTRHLQSDAHELGPAPGERTSGRSIAPGTIAAGTIAAASVEAT